MRLVAAALATIVFCPAHAFGLTVTLTQWDPGTGPLSTSLTVQADNNLCCGGQSLTFEPTSVPFSDSHLTDSGGVTSETSYQLSHSGIEIAPIDHFRLRRSSAGSNGAIYFSIDQDTAYKLTGNYSLDGNLYVALEATLWDLTAGTILFENKQRSGYTPNQTFQLGQAQGDSLNVLSGTRFGILYGGHMYRLTYRTYIGSSEASDSNASASGGLSLNVVPEPTTALPVGIGLLALAARRNRRSEERRRPTMPLEPQSGASS